MKLLFRSLRHTKAKSPKQACMKRWRNQINNIFCFVEKKRQNSQSDNRQKQRREKPRHSVKKNYLSSFCKLFPVFVSGLFVFRNFWETSFLEFCNFNCFDLLPFKEVFAVNESSLNFQKWIFPSWKFCWKGCFWAKVHFLDEVPKFFGKFLENFALATTKNVRRIHQKRIFNFHESHKFSWKFFQTSWKKFHAHEVPKTFMKVLQFFSNFNELSFTANTSLNSSTSLFLCKKIPSKSVAVETVCKFNFLFLKLLCFQNAFEKKTQKTDENWTSIFSWKSYLSMNAFCLSGFCWGSKQTKKMLL